ncbi:MAG: dnaX [Deltaproteobacteria bacterium]|nr:dnaX [Deltaproteobacteria bacterium]
MSYLVLARKWRPQVFEDVVGQEHVTRTLQNAIKTGRVAHAYLFTGARGVGKTSAARILAKALNCINGPTPVPCNTCEACREIAGGSSMDVFEIDGASNTGVDDIRELRENIKFPPIKCRYRIYIIDEVHMLSTNAFNALLKTLEEPPPHVIFVFATTDPQKIPVTILSRCQEFDFKRIPALLIQERLKGIAESEKIKITDRGLHIIAREADGGMRDAQSILDQVISFASA